MNAQRQICEVCKFVVLGDIPADFKCPQCENNIFTPCYCESYPLYLATKEAPRPNICTVCNYVYEKGDFEQLENFSCPQCGQPKEMFQPCSCIKLTDEKKDLTLAQTFVENHALFEELGLDFCCGGERTLGQACLDRGIEQNLVLNRLATEQGRQYTVDEILFEIEAHHSFLKKILPEIQDLAKKAARVHGGNYSRFLTLFALFENQIQVHTYEEDCYFFPLVKEGKMHLAAKMLNKHKEEHQEVGAALRDFRLLLDDYKSTGNDCFTTRTLKEKLTALETDLHLHVGKENHILYPLIEKLAIEKLVSDKQAIEEQDANNPRHKVRI